LALFAFLLVFGFLTNPALGTNEIDSTFLHDSLLANGEIEKIVVLNKELALIYIKKELLKDGLYKGITDGIFSSETGPDYTMVIESIEAFENKVQKAQQGHPASSKVEIQNEQRINWSKLFSWLFPIVAVVILFWLLWPTIKIKIGE
jgi:cell division protease FtsH